MLRNELTIKLNTGQYITHWYDDWKEDEDPRTVWKPFYDWYMNQDTPSYRIEESNADVVEPDETNLHDWVITRKIITQFYFRVYKVKKET